MYFKNKYFKSHFHAEIHSLFKMIDTVADPGEAEGHALPPSPVKENHK